MKNIYTTLNLSKIDIDIVKNLEKDGLNISQLSKKLGTPRSTLYPHVYKLLKRNLLLISKKGKRIFYKALNEDELNNLLITDTLKNKKSIEISDEMSYFTGLKEIQKLWLKIGTQPKSSRVFTFQTNSSLEYSLSKMSVDVAKENHRNIIKNKIILEQYVEEGMHGLVKKLLKQNDISDMFPTSDFTNRTTSTIVLPQGIFIEPIDIIILFDSILIIDWKLEKGYEIKNPNIVSMYKKIFSIVKSHGKLIDNASVTKTVFSE